METQRHIYPRVCDALSRLCQRVFVFELQLGVSYRLHPHVFPQRETSHLPILMSPAEYGNQAVGESQKALQRNVSNSSSAFPQLESRGGPSCPAFPAQPSALALPSPPGMLGSPGAAGGAALRDRSGNLPTQPSGVLRALKPRPVHGAVLCELAGWPLAYLSAFLFSERDRSRVHLL